MKNALTDHRVWKLGGAVVAALIMICAWFLLISPELSAADAARADAASTRQANDQRLIQINALKKQAGQAAVYRRELTEALAALPSDSGLSAFTRQLALQASASHVVIDGITVGGITAASANGTSTTQSGTSTTTAPTAGQLYTVQISLTTHGALADQLALLKAVQYGGARRALVTNTSFAPVAGSAGGSIDQGATLTTQLTVFSSPRTPQQLAVLKKLLAQGSGS